MYIQMAQTGVHVFSCLSGQITLSLSIVHCHIQIYSIHKSKYIHNSIMCANLTHTLLMYYICLSVQCIVPVDWLCFLEKAPFSVSSPDLSLPPHVGLHPGSCGGKGSHDSHVNKTLH